MIIIKFKVHLSNSKFRDAEKKEKKKEKSDKLA